MVGEVCGQHPPVLLEDDPVADAERLRGERSFLDVLACLVDGAGDRDPAVLGVGVGGRANVTLAERDEEAALLLGEARSTVYRAVKAGTFPLLAVRIGERLRIPRSAVDRLIAGDVPARDEQPLQV